jgi:protoporphyrin/coproporphyrin ferrochelatase
MKDRKRIAVILVAHGEAETTGFIENYQVSRHTLDHASTVIHIPPLLQQFISISSSLRKRVRAGSSTAGSPQNGVTREQATALQRELEGQPCASAVDFHVRAAFSASEPYVEELVAETAGYDGQILLPMTPIDNSLSCGLICAHLSEACPPANLHQVKVVGRLWSDEALFGVYLDHLFESGHDLPEKGGDENVLMLLYHGTLVSDTEGRPPAFRTGLDETLAFARRMSTAIGDDPRNRWGRIMTAYLNHDVGGEWTSPSFEKQCESLARSRTSQVTLFAPGYFADGNETIHRATTLAEVVDSSRVGTIPCLNTSGAFVSYLAGRVTRATSQLLRFSGETVCPPGFHPCDSGRQSVY